MHYITNTKKFLTYLNIIIGFFVILQFAFAETKEILLYICLANMVLLIFKFHDNSKARELAILIFNLMAMQLVYLSQLKASLIPYIHNTSLVMLPWLIILSIIPYSYKMVKLCLYFGLFIIAQFTSEYWQVLYLLLLCLSCTNDLMKLENINNLRIYLTHTILLIALITLAIFTSITLHGTSLIMVIALQSALCILGILAWGQTPFIKMLVLISFIYLLSTSLSIATILT